MHLEVVLIKENKAQQRSAHAPLVPEIALNEDALNKDNWQRVKPAVLKHDDVQHCLQHLLKDLGSHLGTIIQSPKNAKHLWPP